MEFSFSEDQDELRRAARRFLEVESSQERVRAAMATEQGFDSAVWGQLSEELAWTALTIPEAYGGLGMSYLDLHPLMEEMGRALLCSPFFSTICLGANALLLGGSEAQKEQHLPSIATGEATSTLAYSEKGRQHGADAIQATYGRDGNDYVIRGTKHYVVDGHTATLLIVAARADSSKGAEGVSLFVVPANTPGLECIWTPTMDQTRKLASVELDGVKVPTNSLLGEEGHGWELCERTLDLARIAFAAEQVGAAEMCHAMAVDYAASPRRTFEPTRSSGSRYASSRSTRWRGLAPSLMARMPSSVSSRDASSIVLRRLSFAATGPKMMFAKNTPYSVVKRASAMPVPSASGSDRLPRMLIRPMRVPIIPSVGAYSTSFLNMPIKPSWRASIAMISASITFLTSSPSMPSMTI